MSDVESRLAALETAVAALQATITPLPPAGDISDEMVSAVYAGLRDLGFGSRAQDVASSNIVGMLRATGGDTSLAAQNFANDALRFRDRAVANLKARGVANPSESDIYDTAGYLLWVKIHDQGTNALAMAQGFPDTLGGL